MTNQMYSVYDEITETYNLPFTAHNDNDAMRMFHNAALSPQTSLNASPQDYTLYHVSTYNQDNAETINTQPPKLIIKLTSLINQNKNNNATEDKQ
ncbi:MAG: nonstructural protein [Microviridae sp.]|nr:MAG: nonstructural protein [Microviridae sp.]